MTQVVILGGDCLSHLRDMPDASYDCIVTSPPYWGLRDYGVEGQIGLEPTMQGYLDTMVGICRELRRVLKPEGTFWLNIGDSYAANRGGTTPPAETLAGGKGGWTENGERVNRGRKDGYNPSRDPKGHGLKHKDLCLIPNRLAIMLQEDGWYVRSEIIWHKPNPMPESVRDRPTCAHEKVWLLTKSERYFYNAAAIRTPLAEASVARLSQDVENQEGSRRANGGSRAERPLKAVKFGGDKKQGDYGSAPRRANGNAWDGAEGANARNVWSITTKPFKEAHFATMPPDLAERCIKAGCPQGGRVLDPFGGAGTTGLVAASLGREATLIELNPEYRDIALSRISTVAPVLEIA